MTPNVEAVGLARVYLSKTRTILYAMSVCNATS